jgi:hypothetical protein
LKKNNSVKEKLRPVFSYGYYKYKGKNIDKFTRKVVKKKEEYYRVVKAKDLIEENLEPLKKKNIKVK